MNTVTSCSRRRERGTQVVEFALVLPLLAFLVLAVIEGSGFVRMHQLLNNMAREGARIASLGVYQPNNQVSDHSPSIVAAMAAYAQSNGATLPTLAEGGAAPVGACSAGSASCFTWTATSMDKWNCKTLSVTIDQGVTMPGPNGVSIGASHVLVTCAYSLQYLPKLPWYGLSAVNLATSAEFRNLK